MSLLISEDELNSRIKNADIVYHRIGKGNTSNHENSGRNKGDNNVVPFIRELIATEALDPLNNATAKEIAQEWNVSESSVNNYKNGKHTNSEPKMAHSEIVTKADETVKLRKEKIVEVTTLKLMAAMESIRVEKIDKEKPLIQSQIARNLASTLEKLEGRNNKDEDGGSNGDVHYHVHIPAPIKLELFDEVVIDEKPLK